jgi:hypothetical protein
MGRVFRSHYLLDGHLTIIQGSFVSAAISWIEIMNSVPQSFPQRLLRNVSS